MTRYGLCTNRSCPYQLLYRIALYNKPNEYNYGVKKQTVVLYNRLISLPFYDHYLLGTAKKTRHRNVLITGNRKHLHNTTGNNEKSIFHSKIKFNNTYLDKI